MEPRPVPVPKLNREEIRASLGGEPKEISTALLSAAYWDSDWKWPQDLLLQFADHSSPDVQWAVATGLGFIAAFHGQLETDRGEPILRNLNSEAASEALLDIDHFVRRRQAGEDIDLAGEDIDLAERLAD